MELVRSEKSDQGDHKQVKREKPLSNTEQKVSRCSSEVLVRGLLRTFFVASLPLALFGAKIILQGMGYFGGNSES